MDMYKALAYLDIQQLFFYHFLDLLPSPSSNIPHSPKYQCCLWQRLKIFISWTTTEYLIKFRLKSVGFNELLDLKSQQQQ